MDIARRMIADAAVQRSRIETLSRQSATGQRAERSGELGADLGRSITLRGDIARRDASVGLLEQAQGRATVTQQAMGRMMEIAREFRTDVTSRISASDPSSLLTAPSRARAALQEVAGLLNTRYAGEYVFSGTDVSRPAIPDPGAITTGPLFSAIQADVQSLGGAMNADQVNAATRTAAQDTSAALSPFSAFVQDPAGGASEAPRSVITADGQEIAFGIFADRNTGVQSTGETTGSWSRDLLRNLMTVASLTPDQMRNAPAEFDKLIGMVRSGFQSAESAIADEKGVLGTRESQMEGARTRSGNLADAMRRQLAGLVEVDVARTITDLQSTRTALEASYRTIATVTGLSLANFLR